MKKRITKQQLRAVAQKIIKEFRSEKIILFGSYAWGDPCRDSDIDLFVVKKTNNTRQMSRKISRSIFPRHFAMDIFVYTPSQTKARERMGDFFIKKILMDGKTLYDKGCSIREDAVESLEYVPYP